MIPKLFYRLVKKLIKVKFENFKNFREIFWEKFLLKFWNSFPSLKFEN